MKKLTIYEINDGFDGVIIAKSLKQAIKKLVPYYDYSVREVINSIKRSEYVFNEDWILTYSNKIAKKGKYKKSKVVGWTE